jgi:membrane associated rhomboid family serine protease
LFGILYLSASLGAAVAHLLLDGRPTIGASGAVMGILGMYVAICYQRFGRTGPLLVCIWLGLTLGFGFSHYGYAAHMAHAGGFFTGFCLALLFMSWDRIDVDATEAHPEVQQWVGVSA